MTLPRNSEGLPPKKKVKKIAMPKTCKNETSLFGKKISQNAFFKFVI